MQKIIKPETEWKEYNGGRILKPETEFEYECRLRKEGEFFIRCLSQSKIDWMNEQSRIRKEIRIYRASKRADRAKFGFITVWLSCFIFSIYEKYERIFRKHGIMHYFKLIFSCFFVSCVLFSIFFCNFSHLMKFFLLFFLILCTT